MVSNATRIPIRPRHSRPPLVPPAAFLNGERPGREDDVWVIVPAYNEGERLGRTPPPLCNRYANIVLVDDGSRDNSSRHRRHPALYLQHLVNLGAGAATQTGLCFALGRGPSTS